MNMRRPIIIASALLIALAAPGARALSPFYVFFDPGSVALSPQAIRILDNAALSWAAWEEGPSLNIEGHSDSVGSAVANQRLSCARARAVRDYLIGRGVPKGHLAIAGGGERLLLIETADEVAEPQNRRATIVFGEPASPPSFTPKSRRC